MSKKTDSRGRTCNNEITGRTYSPFSLTSLIRQIRDWELYNGQVSGVISDSFKIGDWE